MQSDLVVQPHARPIAVLDVASIMYRHSRLLSITFLSVICAALAIAFLLPSKYESSVKLLVERGRPDAVLSAGPSDAYQPPPQEVSEADLDSELELLKTRDILHKVVLQNGLAGSNPSSIKLDQAIIRLNSDLHAAPIGKSNVIEATYRSKSPRLSANVLNSLIALYLDKHLQIRRSTRQYQFFDQQAQLYKAQLAQVEKQIANAKVVAPELTRDQMVDKLADLRASAALTEADIAATKKEIASLKELEGHTPERLVAETKTLDNPQLLQQMKGTLLTLQLQRDQLVAKYQPTYRPVQDIDKRIADTRAAITLEESKPLREETTNQNAAFDWIRTEMVKAQSQLQSLQGRQKADNSILATDDQNLQGLNVDAIKQQDLQRAEKTAEANYLLYSQKMEEARISEQLDARRLLNVVEIQSAFIPAVHVHQRATILMIGLIAAILLSLMTVLVSDFFDPRFRSLNEFAAFLEVPVLAAISSSYPLTSFERENRASEIPGDKSAA